MKTSFRVFALILVALFSVAFIGCSGDDEDEAVDEFTGKYTATEISVEAGGSSVVIRPPDLFGQLTLGSRGGPWSLTILFTESDLLPESERIDLSGTTWIANGTDLWLDEEPAPYTWDGTYLIFSVTEDELTLRFKWQKL